MALREQKCKGTGEMQGRRRAYLQALSGCHHSLIRDVMEYVLLHRCLINVFHVQLMFYSSLPHASFQVISWDLHKPWHALSWLLSLQL